MKKLTWLLGTILTVSLALTGCAPKTETAAAPAAAPAETTAPATTAAPAASAETAPAADAATDGTIVGVWVSQQDGQTIEFTADGIYNGATQKNYRYELLENSQLRLVNPMYADGSDSIVMDYVLEGDTLKTNYRDFEVVWKKK